MEGHNEQKIQPDIEDGGKQQEQKRRYRIPHAAQKGADKIIEKLRPDAREDDSAVGMGRAVHLRTFRRHIDPRQHRLQEQQCQPGQQHRQRRRKQDLRRQRAPHPGFMVGAHLRGRHHAKTRADAKRELQKDKDNGGGIIHPGHLTGRQRLPHYGRIADGIHLLQQVTDDNGQRKCQDRLPGGALCQIPRLKKPPQGKLGCFLIHILHSTGRSPAFRIFIPLTN